MNKLHISQGKLIQKIKKLFVPKKITDNEYSRLGLFYLTPFGQTKGNAKLFFFFNKVKFFKSYFKLTFLDLYNVLRAGNFETISPESVKEYKTIIVNWGTSKDFKKTGEFYDKYFNVSSKKCKDILWYIIYLDNNLPKKIDKNLILVYKKKTFLNFLHLKKIFKDILTFKKKIRFVNQEISYHSIFASYVDQDFNKFILPNLKKIIMPYEGQPFQNVICLKAAKVKNNIKTIGYVHSFPIGLPSNLVKRPGNPKTLYINGISQKYALEKFFGWKTQKLKVLPSARLNKQKKNIMNNKIFLPINFESPKKILKNIINLMNYTNTDFSNLDIKNHPRCFKSSKHLNLVNEIQYLIKNYNKNKKSLSNFSIFIGPTGSVIEALERNVNVYHICENPILETYTKKIWKYINCYQIGSDLFKYKKINEQKLLKLSNDKQIYKKYIY